jgi:hypothetical protein
MATKKRKYPKQPKAGASLQTWERYKARIQDVDRFNSSIEAAKKKKAAVVSAVLKMKSKR